MFIIVFCRTAKMTPTLFVGYFKTNLKVNFSHVDIHVDLQKKTIKTRTKLTKLKKE